LPASDGGRIKNPDETACNESMRPQSGTNHLSARKANQLPASKNTHALRVATFFIIGEKSGLAPAKQSPNVSY
jgi:hypothetical protein